MSFKEFMRGVKNGLVKHSPEILVGLGIAGSVGAVIFGIKATPKAIKLIDERKKKEKKQKLTVPEVIGTTWKCYIPCVALETASIACILGSRKIDAKRYAALAAAYSLAESQITEYKDKVKEVVGEKKAVQIEDAIAEDKVKAIPVKEDEIIYTGHGETLCLDAVSGRYFKSDIEKIRRARDQLNVRLRNEEYISLNEWYYELNLPSISIGDSLGWNIDNGYIDICFSSQLASNEKPCLVVGYSIGPRWDFQSLH